MDANIPEILVAEGPLKGSRYTVPEPFPRVFPRFAWRSRTAPQ